MPVPRDAAALEAKLDAAAAESERLAALKDEVGEAPIGSPSYHGGRRATREIGTIIPNNPESAKMAQRAAELDGLKNAEEVKFMEGMQAVLSTQYMNPAFMQYLRQEGKEGAVYPWLDMVLKNPSEFKYTNRNGEVWIQKREPDKNPNPPIRNDFLIVVKTGQISKVNDINLEVDGQMPWMSNPKYNENMANYQAAYATRRYDGIFGSSAYKELYNNPARHMEDYRKLKKEALQDMPPGMKEMFELHNRDFPKHLVGLINIRNLPWEMTNQYIIDLKTQLNLQGKDFEDMVIKGNLHIEVVPSLVRGVYELRTDKNKHNPLCVNEYGYIVIKQRDGTYKPDCRYMAMTSRQYYKDHPGARVDLDAIAGRDMDAMEVRINGPDLVAQKELEKINEKEARVNAMLDQLAKTNKKTPAEKTADFTQLKVVANAIMAGTYTDAAIADMDSKTETNGGVDVIRLGIEKVLRAHPDKYDVAAGVLGTDLNHLEELHNPNAPATTPTATPPATPTVKPTLSNLQLKGELDGIKTPDRMNEIFVSVAPPDKPVTINPKNQMNEQKSQLKKWLDKGDILPQRLQNAIEATR